MDRKAKRCLQNFWGIMNQIPWGGAAQFDRRLGSHPPFHAGDAACFGESASPRVLNRDTQELKLLRVKLYPSSPLELLHKKAAAEVAQGESIGFSYLIDMVGCNQTSGSGHVLHDDGRVAGDVFAHVAGNGAGIGIKTSSGGEADHDAHGLAFIKKILGGDQCRPQAQGEPNGKSHCQKRDLLDHENLQLNSCAKVIPSRRQASSGRA
jgi:hypothetical protein